MTISRAEVGDILIDVDFGGPEIPDANTVVITSGNHRGFMVGPLKVTGSLHDTDSGLTSVAISNGAARLASSATADGDGIAIGTEVIFDATLNGGLSLETRVQRAADTAGNIFIGFAGLNADEVAPTLTSTTITHTLTDGNIAGFHIDTSLTASTAWHSVFNGGAVTGPTNSENTVTGTSNARNINRRPVVDLVAGEWDLLKVEISTNGTVEWWINEILMQRQAGAVSTSTDLAALVGIWSTTTTVATMDVDYFLCKARRSWAR